MTDKELRSLNRAELLEMLIKLSKENEELRKQLGGLREELNNRQIKIDNAGSIAEAALSLNGVFEAAEAAAKQYLDNVTRSDEICREKLLAAEEKADKSIALACETAKSIVSEATHKADDIITKAKTESDAIVSKAKTEADAYRADASKQIDDILSSYQGLRELLFTDLKMKTYEE